MTNYLILLSHFLTYHTTPFSRLSQNREKKKINSSGQLNAKHRELLDLQAQAQARLARTRARFQEGLQDAQDVRADLEWTSKKVS